MTVPVDGWPVALYWAARSAGTVKVRTRTKHRSGESGDSSLAPAQHRNCRNNAVTFLARAQAGQSVENWFYFSRQKLIQSYSLF